MEMRTGQANSAEEKGGQPHQSDSGGTVKVRKTDTCLLSPRSGASQIRIRKRKDVPGFGFHPKTLC